MLSLITLLAALVASDVTQSISVPASRAAHTVAILPMRGEMDAIAMEGLSDRVRAAREAGADAIVIAFDTPGGELMSTLELCRRIKSEYPANTVAWIRPRAYSAGTIAALACREIIVTPDAVFGDAAPIAVSPWSGLQSLPPTERAKMEAPLLSEVTDSARRRGHDERLCRAFISASDALWLLEDPRRKERFIVDAEEYRAIFGIDPPTSVDSITHAPTPTPMQLLPWLKDALRRSSGDAAMESLEATQRAPRGRPLLTNADADRLHLVSQIDNADELLTLRADESLALGLAKTQVADEAELRNFFAADRSFTLEPRWSEGVARLLTSWWVRVLLVLTIVVCFVGEMLAPGLGVFSIVLLAAASLLIGGPLLAGLADWWPAVALLAGLALVALELLVMPGSLVVGIAGALAFAAGTLGLFVVSDPSPDPTNGIVQGVCTLVAAIAAAITMGWFMARGETGMFGRAVLRAQVVNERVTLDTSLLGAEGVAHTDLRPVGRILIQQTLYEVRATGFVDRGTRVRVLRYEGAEIIVEACA